MREEKQRPQTGCSQEGEPNLTTFLPRAREKKKKEESWSEMAGQEGGEWGQGEVEEGLAQSGQVI